MRAFIYFLILFSYLSGVAHPKIFRPDSAILNPSAGVGKFVMYSDGYEDQRFDVDLDGSIDFWRLRQENLMVDISFKSSEVVEIFIRRIAENTVSEALYRKKGEVLSLDFSQTRARFQMNFSEGDHCPSSTADLNNKLEEYKGFEDLTTPVIAKSLIDESCKKDLGSGYPSLGVLVMKYLKGQDRISQCVTQPKFREGFPPGIETDISVEVLRTTYKLERAKLIKDTEKHKPLISCEKIDERKGKQPGIFTTEGGKITIAVSEDIPVQKINPAQLEHELLHRIGLYSEASVNKIIRRCNDLDRIIGDKDLKTVAATDSGMMPSSLAVGKEAQAEGIKDSGANVALNSAKPASSLNGAKNAPETASAAKTAQQPETYQSAVNAGSTATANIPKTLTVAQTQVPSSESLSETIYTNHQKTDAGITNAYAKSTSQSRGVLSMANNLAGAMTTPAEASLAKAKNQVREIAASSESSITPKAGSNLAGAGGLVSRNKIGSDETVVESITLDPQKTVVSRVDAAAPTNQEGRSPASDSRALPTAEISASNLKAASVSSSASDFGVANVNPVGDNTQASLGNKNPDNQRSPANVGKRSIPNGAANSAGSPEELITYISQSNYNDTKRKLNDPNFARQLETNGIKIIDMKGGFWGAKDGKIKFLDDEVKFVLQSK